MPKLSRRTVVLALPVLAVAGRAWAQQDWSAQPLQLMMVSSPYCHFCRAWRAEIAPGYAASPAGRVAPLFDVDVDGPFPDGLALDRRPRITPSFILLDRGTEIGRVEGYVGKHYFHPVLEEMMQRAGVDLAAS
ncbi:thioredoxin domain-containing protein [Paracoccus beibuensis]|uniref:SoxS protein n=1 Tax=Paracoccus beibuensis TaxID=547602 RepID=UPI0022409651|nr:SoxS protein [Paracoccus beibuensis]